MELFIRIENGNPVDHPILGDNFKQVFLHIDINNLPPEFAKFVRKPIPEMGPYEVHESSEYGWENDVVTDIHIIRQMTEEEKTTKQNNIKLMWTSSNGFKSWIFNEEKCEYEAPVPKPNDGKKYYWNEINVNWEIFNPDQEE